MRLERDFAVVIVMLVALGALVVLSPENPGPVWGLGFALVGAAAALTGPATMCIGLSSVVAYGELGPNSDETLWWALGLIGTVLAALAVGTLVEQAKTGRPHAE